MFHTGGLLAGSLAIMTDAAHMLSDFAAFLISLFAIWVAHWLPDKKRTFGYYRAGILKFICIVCLRKTTISPRSALPSALWDVLHGGTSSSQRQKNVNQCKT